jgi:putative ABC transport system permease protein
MAWRLAIRVARREAMRNKRRSLLVAAMIALPVAGASAADTLWHSTQLTTAEQATRDMGRYDAVVHAPWDVPLEQSPDGTTVANVRGPNAPDGSVRIGVNTSPSALLAVLPVGSRVVPFVQRSSDEVQVARGAGRLFARLAVRDLTDPMQKDLTVHRGGTAPASDDEVAVSGSTLSALGKKIGDSIEVGNRLTGIGKRAGSGGATAADSKMLRITGVYDLPDELDAQAVFVPPARSATPRRRPTSSSRCPAASAGAW